MADPLNPGAAGQAAQAARSAEAAFARANAGLASLKVNAVGLGAALAGPLVMIARGATVTQAAFQGVKAAIVGRVLGPIGMVSGAALGLIGTMKVLAMTFGRAGVEARAGLEKMEVGFRPLLKSSALAKQRVKELVDFSKNSPFRLDSVAAANKSLQYLTRGALSTKAGMRLVGDAAAASGSDFEETAFSVGKLYEAIQSGAPVQRASMRLEWMGMISAGTAQKLDALQASGASSAEVWGAMERELARSEGGMAKMAVTLDAMRTKLEMTQRVASAGFGEGFMEGQKATISATQAAVENLTPAFTTLGQVIGILPNFFARLWASILTGLTAGVVMPRIFLTAAAGIVVLTTAIVALQAVQLGKVLMGIMGFGPAATAARAAGASLATVQVLLSQGAAALAKNQVYLAAVTYRAALAQSIASVRANGLTGVVAVLAKGMRVLGAVIWSTVRAAFAAMITPIGLLIMAIAGLALAGVAVVNSMRASAAAVDAAREASEAHTVALREQIRAMSTAEDAAKNHSTAMQTLRDAEAQSATTNKKYTGLWNRGMNAIWGTGDAEKAENKRAEVRAREGVEAADAVDPSRLGVGDEERGKRRQRAQDAQGELFYAGMTDKKVADEQEARDTTRQELVGVGPKGKRLRELEDERARARSGKDTDLAHVNDLTGMISKERQGIMEGSGSAEMRARAKLVEDDERRDIQSRDDKAARLSGKVQRASKDKGKMKELAAETDDAELKGALNEGWGDSANKRARELALRARTEAIDTAAPMDPKAREGLQNKVADEQARHDPDTQRQRTLRDEEAGYDAQRAAGEQKLAALKDEGYDATVAELGARREALDLEEKILAARLAMGRVGEKDAAAARARIATQRTELDVQARLAREQTERETKRASLTMKASLLETRALDQRRSGDHFGATESEKQAEQLQLAEKRIQLEQSARGMDEKTLREQGFTGEGANGVRKDYVDQNIAGEQAKLDQQRRFREEDKALTRRRSMADQTVAEGELQGKVLTMGGHTQAGKAAAEGARRASDEVRREELRRQNIGTGMTDEDASALADRQIKTDQASRALDLLGSGLGSTTASSMAAIGGGGGVAGVDAMVNRQEIANGLLREIRDATKGNVKDVTKDDKLG